MARVAKLEQQARATARGRRMALDQGRAARDKRVESLAAEAILALGALDDQAGHVRVTEVRIGDALRAIIAEGVQEAGAAQLCDLSVGEVRRFRRAAQAAHDSAGDSDCDVHDDVDDGVDAASPAGPTDPAGPDQGLSPEVAPAATSDARTRAHGIQTGTYPHPPAP